MERRKKVGKGKLLPSGVTKLARNSAGKKEREIISDQLTSAAQDPYPNPGYFPFQDTENTQGPSEMNSISECVHNIFYLIFGEGGFLGT